MCKPKRKQEEDKVQIEKQQTNQLKFKRKKNSICTLTVLN